MAYTERLNFEVTYKSKKYVRVVDFATAVGLNTRVVLERWKLGKRTPEELAKPLQKHGDFHDPYQLKYKGIEYKSLRQFCRQFDLSYTKVLKIWHSSTHEPAKIIKLAKTKDAARALKENKQRDTEEKYKYLHQMGLFSAEEVAEKTKISADKIRSTAHDLLRTGRRRLKSDVSSIGLKRTDLENLEDNPKTQQAISNLVVLPKIAFKPSAIEHINARARALETLDLVQIPFVNNNYFFSPTTQTVWSKKNGSYFQLNAKGTFNLKDNGVKYLMRLSTIEDTVNHPNITYKDLIAPKELANACCIYGPNYWRNNGLYHVLPALHRRVDLNNHQGSKLGYDKNELLKNFEKDNRTKKYVPLLQAYLKEHN